MTEDQIRFLERHQAAFDEAYSVPGEHRPVREYVQEYSYIPDLFTNICNDLGLDPGPLGR